MAGIVKKKDLQQKPVILLFLFCYDNVWANQRKTEKNNLLLSDPTIYMYSV